MALGTTGAILQTRANSLIERYDLYVAVYCPNGCPRSSTPLSKRDDASTLRTWANISYGIGATTLIGGAVWALWFNRPRLRRSYTPEQRERLTLIAPLVGSNLAGAMVTKRF